MKPRDYQEAAHAALLQAVHQSVVQNPLVVMPTGTGKSLQMALFIWHMLSMYPTVRMLSLVHTKELVAGNYKTLKKIWLNAPAGIYSAGLKRKDTRAQVTFCGIQSVRTKANTFGKIDFVIVDEAHRISPDTEKSYGRFIADLRKKNPNLIVVGFTATPYRMGSGLLTDEGQLFDNIAFDLSDGEAFVWLINNGYLSKPIPKDPGFQVDESGVSINGGEYQDGSASAAFRDQGILERAVEQSASIGDTTGRHCWLAFCQSIDDAELVADMYRYYGYPVEAVTSQSADRDGIIAKLQRGELRGVTNRDILTTGFDHPDIDMIVMLRLTRSPSLWVQMLGRGTRPVFAPGYDITTLQGRLDAIAAGPKQNCLVLDYAGNTDRLGPINYPVVPRKRGKGGGLPPSRKCPDCGTYHHVSVKVCDECGYEFPPPERLGAASGKELVRSDFLDLSAQPPPPEFHNFGVQRMVCSHHKGKNGKPDTLRVDYYCEVQRFSKWVCVEHPKGSFPRRQAEEWWEEHGAVDPLPDTIVESLAEVHALVPPRAIRVRVDTKFPEIVDYNPRGYEPPPEAPPSPGMAEAFDDDIPF